MERLEFLGDRVLGLVISEAIFSKFDLFNEGDLSKYHNYLVQRSTCVIIAKKINLNNFIIFGNYLNDIVGQVFVFFILTVVAAESAIGLAIIVVLFRNKNSIDVEDIGRLKG